MLGKNTTRRKKKMKSEEKELILSIVSDVLILLRTMVDGADDIVEFTVIPKEKKKKTITVEEVKKPKTDKKKKKFIHWTEEECTFLMENYGKMPAYKIAMKLKRSRNSVVSKAHDLALTGIPSKEIVLNSIRKLKAGTSQEIGDILKVKANKLNLILHRMSYSGFCRKFYIKKGENKIVDMLFSPYLNKVVYYFIQSELEEWIDGKFPKELGGDTKMAHDYLLKKIGMTHKLDCKCKDCTEIRKLIKGKVNSGEIYLSGTETDKKKVMETDGKN